MLPSCLVWPVLRSLKPTLLIKGQILRTSMLSMGPGRRSALQPSARPTRFVSRRFNVCSWFQTALISWLFLEIVFYLMSSSSFNSWVTAQVSLTSTSARSRNDPPAINHLGSRCVLVRCEVPSAKCCRASKLFWISLIKNNVGRMQYY